MLPVALKHEADTRQSPTMFPVHEVTAPHVAPPPPHERPTNAVVIAATSTTPSAPLVMSAGFQTRKRVSRTGKRCGEATSDDGRSTSTPRRRSTLLDALF